MPTRSKKELPPTTRRSDYGRLKRKPRDWGAMELIGAQKWVRFDTLGEYWAPDHAPALPFSPEPQQPASPESLPQGHTRRGGSRKGWSWPSDWPHRNMAVARMLYKLQAHGLVKLWQPWDQEPQWVTLTEEGYRYRHLPWHELDWPDEDELRHDGTYYRSHLHLINQSRVRLLAGLPVPHSIPGQASAPLRPRFRSKRQG